MFYLWSKDGVYTPNGSDLIKCCSSRVAFSCMSWTELRHGDFGRIGDAQCMNDFACYDLGNGCIYVLHSMEN